MARASRPRPAGRRRSVLDQLAARRVYRTSWPC